MGGHPGIGICSTLRKPYHVLLMANTYSRVMLAPCFYLHKLWIKGSQCDCGKHLFSTGCSCILSAPHRCTGYHTVIAWVTMDGADCDITAGFDTTIRSPCRKQVIPAQNPYTSCNKVVLASVHGFPQFRPHVCNSSNMTWARGQNIKSDILIL